MADENWEDSFKNIIEHLDMEDLSDPRGNLTLWEVNRAVAGMNEASAYLGRFIAEVLKESLAVFPAELAPILRQVTEMTDQISEVLSKCSCAECQAAEDILEKLEACPMCADAEEGICEECLEYFTEEEDE